MGTHYLALEDDMKGDRLITKEEPWGRLLGPRREYELAKDQENKYPHKSQIVNQKVSNQDC